MAKRPIPMPKPQPPQGILARSAPPKPPVKPKPPSSGGPYRFVDD